MGDAAKAGMERGRWWRSRLPFFLPPLVSKGLNNKSQAPTQVVICSNMSKMASKHRMVPVMFNQFLNSTCHAISCIVFHVLVTMLRFQPNIDGFVQSYVDNCLVQAVQAISS